MEIDCDALGVSTWTSSIFSCFVGVSMEIDSEGNIIASDVYKAVIRVTERMTYTDVQKIIDV